MGASEERLVGGKPGERREGAGAILAMYSVAPNPLLMVGVTAAFLAAMYLLVCKVGRDKVHDPAPSPRGGRRRSLGAAMAGAELFGRLARRDGIRYHVRRFLGENRRMWRAMGVVAGILAVFAALPFAAYVAVCLACAVADGDFELAAAFAMAFA